MKPKMPEFIVTVDVGDGTTEDVNLADSMWIGEDNSLNMDLAKACLMCGVDPSEEGQSKLNEMVKAALGRAKVRIPIVNIEHL